jgi:hypothetical protein
MWLDTLKLFPRGTSVRVKLSYEGAEVKALAKVVYSSTDLGMGVALNNFEGQDERILEWWIAGLLSVPIR